MAKIEKTAGIEIQEMKMGQLTMHIVGSTPMIMHRFSQKAQIELLLPAKKKNRAEKEASLKHDPVAEYRACIYMNRPERRKHSLIHIPSNSFGAALANAALDVPGATKAQLMRLTSIKDVHIDMFGVPQLFMAMVRSSDMNRTPDVRTRAIFPRWACSVTVSYVASLLKEGQIANLMAFAGQIIGIGDWRSQKGGSYGSFRIVEANDPEYLDIIATEDAKAQAAAIATPVCYDAESEELLALFNEEVKKRERVLPSANNNPLELDDELDDDEMAALNKRAKNGQGAHAG